MNTEQKRNRSFEAANSEYNKKHPIVINEKKLYEMDTVQFIKAVNNLRLYNKGQWYTISVIVNGKFVSLKGFGNWIQRIKIDNIIDSGPMDCSVKTFKQFLFDSVN